MVRHSATLAVNERIAALRAQGRDVVHLGFGEAGLPVLPAVADVLRDAAGHNSYGPVVGSRRAREAAAGYLRRRGIAADPDRVVFAPGSKPLLYGVIASLPGDVVLPVPSWVSYAAQASLTGKRVVGVPIPAAAGGVPDPDLLPGALAAARRDGADPRILILTLPDNPTGTTAGADLVRAVCAVAEQQDLMIVSDEIYRDLTHDGSLLTSPAALLPGRTVVTGGLSKHLALGGWRIGFASLPGGTPDGAPSGELAERLAGVASEIWSSLAAPMQEVAAYVLDEPAEVTAHVAASRRLHAAVSRAVHAVFADAGARCRPPDAAFYLYPDLAHLRPALAADGVDGGRALADLLLDRYGIAVLAGEFFGDDPSALRLRVATSLLYGADDEQRWAALQADDATTLPWITAALDRLRTALADLH